MKGKQTKNNPNDFRATDSEFWKKQHGYDDKKAEKASDWMSKHYSDLGETVKINECGISKLVAEALKRCLNRLNETEYTSLKSKDTRKGKVGVSKDDEDKYYVDYDGKHYHVPSQEDADRWHEILSIDESRIKAIVKESLNNILKEDEEKAALGRKKQRKMLNIHIKLPIQNGFWDDEILKDYYSACKIITKLLKEYGITEEDFAEEAFLKLRERQQILKRKYPNGKKEPEKYTGPVHVPDSFFDPDMGWH